MSSYTFEMLAVDVLKSAGRPLTAKEIWDEAKCTGLADRKASNGHTPWKSVEANITREIKKNGDGSKFIRALYDPVRYYLRGLPFEAVSSDDKSEPVTEIEKRERDLHRLLTTFVEEDAHFRCKTKTIHHERSAHGSSGSDRWTYPDIVGIYFPFGQYHKLTVDLIDTTRSNPFRLFSFEMKWELDTATVREKYFQAVSNSSWANEGYIVAPTIETGADFLSDLSRLVNAFGIGVIRLDVDNIEQSEVLFPARYREDIDWETVDRLMVRNSDFREFVTDVNLDVADKHIRGNYEPPLAPEEYDGYVRSSSVALLLGDD